MSSVENMGLLPMVIFFLSVLTRLLHSEFHCLDAELSVPCVLCVCVCVFE